MLKWLISWRIAAFERKHNSDMGYARHIANADLGAFVKFTRVMTLARYRKDLPGDVWYAAKLVATVGEDCGPCTQLVVRLAESEGMAPDVLKAILAGDAQALSDDVSLGVRFTKAVLARAPTVDDLRAQVVRRWGQQGLLSLGFAIMTARMFPTIKYALGYGQACTRITVAGAPASVAKNFQVTATG